MEPFCFGPPEGSRGGPVFWHIKPAGQAGPGVSKVGKIEFAFLKAADRSCAMGCLSFSGDRENCSFQRPEEGLLAFSPDVSEGNVLDLEAKPPLSRSIFVGQCVRCVCMCPHPYLPLRQLYQWSTREVAKWLSETAPKCLVPSTPGHFEVCLGPHHQSYCPCASADPKHVHCIHVLDRGSLCTTASSRRRATSSCRSSLIQCIGAAGSWKA